MKIVNVMNFVRQCHPLNPSLEPNLYKTTKEQLELVKEFKIDSTFLLQYDTFCNEEYVKLIKENMTEQTEIGLWYEIVEEMTTACGMPYRSEKGWSWDWHIIPGFSMGYTVEDREKLIDEAMRKFKEVFGFYPRTVASWIIDTHTTNYMAKKYDIDVFCNCRDQINTDAYTLIGGYFNQGYYPSKNNVFTPAQTDEYRLNVPMLRLLGPSPIQNYDSKKFVSEEMKPVKRTNCWTLEPVWYSGFTPEVVDWFFKTYFQNEDLGFSYAQLGQENSFGAGADIVTPLRMQIEHLMASHPDVKFQKMCDTGKWFKQTYPNKTPATSLVALDNWDTTDVQSAYYDCQNFTVNLFRYENQAFLRLWYLFDETVVDRYMTEVCDRFDAVYDNLPIVDTVLSTPEKKTDIGLLIDDAATPFEVKKAQEGVLDATWGDKKVTMSEQGLEFFGIEKLTWFKESLRSTYEIADGKLKFCFEGNNYSISCVNCTVTETENALLVKKNAGTTSFALYVDRK